MAANSRGGSLAVLALVISSIALALSIQIYLKVEGTRVLEEQAQVLHTALDAVRTKTADVLAQLERAVRPVMESGDTCRPSAPSSVS